MGTKESDGIKADTELPKPHEPRVDPTPRMSDHDDERKHEFDYTRRVRPSMLQKLVKKFDGSGDPYDHIATFRQVVRAEQVSDNHTQIEGFGLTLKGKALSWFQTLEPSTITTLQSLEKDFIAAFSKMGIKHNAVAQIYAFRQKAHESVRDCVNRLKQYITRCPNKEKPSQRRLISIFLEGLQNKILHAHLYAKKHTCFNECCLDAMDYDDNFDMSSVSSQEDQPRERHEPSKELDSKAKELNTEQIADIVVRRMEQLYCPPITYQQESTNMPMRKWCQLCKWNFTHTTQECQHIPRMLQEQTWARPLQQPKAQVMTSERPFVPMQVQEQARPVSLAQPPVHVTAPSTSNQDNSKNDEGETKSTKVGTCMECGEDHWMKDCPLRQVPTTQPGEKV